MKIGSGMMKKCLAPLAAVFCLFASVQAQGAKLTFTYKGAPAGKVRLIGVYANQNIAIDSATADAGGMVIFTRQTPYEGGFYYVVYSDNSYFFILLDKDQEFTITADKSDWVGTAKSEGSLDNELYFQNLKFEKDFKPRLDSVLALIKAQPFGSAEYERLEKVRINLEDEKETHVKSFAKNYPNSFFTKFKTQGQNPKWKDIRKPNGEIDTLQRFYTFRDEYWNGYDFNDERLLRTPVYYNKLNSWLTTYIPQHQDSLILAADFIIPKTKGNKEMFKFTSNFIAMTYKQGKLMDWEKVYSHIILKYITYEDAFWADSSEVKKTRFDAQNMTHSFLFMKGENLHCPDENGVYHDLDTIKAEYTLIFIYNPVCEHCMEEAPQLVEFYKKWRPKGVQVYCLTNEIKELQKWVEFKKKFNLPFITVWDPGYQSGFYWKYYVDITPELYVLDRNKTIIGKNLHVNQLEEFLTRDMEKK